MPDFSSSLATPLQPQRLSRNEARARTTIAQRASAMPLRLGDAVWRVDLRPQTFVEPSHAGDWMLALEWAGAVFHLQLPKAAVNQIAAPLLPGASLPKLPDELALAILEAALSDATLALQSLGRGTPQLLEMRQGAAAPAACPHTLALCLHGPENQAAIAATLHADSLGLLLLSGLVGKRAPASPVLDGQLSLRLPAEIGFTLLSAGLLATLSRGDVVLMDRCHIGTERVLWLSADGKAGLQARLPSPDSVSENEAVPPALTVIQAWSSAMPSETPPDTTIASMDGVPIRLSFDLGEITLTVAEARALQPGQAIALARPLAGAVRIRANGAQVGEGDLVEIDGQLGVSIRALFPASMASGESAE